MAGIVTTSLVVQFGSESLADKYHLSAEIDSRPDGLNGGNTTFVGGDSPIFLVYASSELNLSFVQSVGSQSPAGTGTVDVDEWITFANEKTSSLSKYPNGTVSLEHFAGDTTGKVVGNTVVLDKPGVAVYKATYTAAYTAYKMTSIPLEINDETSFPVIVVITGNYE
jgi:hypothetical protein